MLNRFHRPGRGSEKFLYVIILQIDPIFKAFRGGLTGLERLLNYKEGRIVMILACCFSLSIHSETAPVNFSSLN